MFLSGLERLWGNPEGDFEPCGIDHRRAMRSAPTLALQNLRAHTVHSCDDFYEQVYCAGPCWNRRL
jgi:hypothetical protein